MTSYEEAINRASLALALENPVLISKKGRLFDLAKQKLLDSGYHYKRGSSRSKLKTSSSPTIVCQESILAKREENAQRMSEHRLEKMDQLQNQVDYALQSRQRIENQLAASFSTSICSQRRIMLKSDLAKFEEMKNQLTKELSQLKAQERKHQWYKRRKLEKHALQDEGFSSQTSQEDDNESHPSAFSSYSSQESTNTNSGIMTCSRTSDVRASSISDYDR